MSKHPTIAEHLEASGVSRRSFIQLCEQADDHRAGGIVAYQQEVGLRASGGDRQDEAAISNLAAFPGLYGMHRDSAADLRSRCCSPYPRRDLPRLPRDPDGCLGRAGRSGAALRHGRQRWQVCAGGGRRDSHKGRRRLHGDEQQAGSSDPEGNCCPGGSGDRHRLLRLVGRCALGGPNPPARSGWIPSSPANRS